MAEYLPFEIRPIPPFTNEWAKLAITVYAALVDEGLYTAQEVEGMADPEQHEASWLPRNRYIQLVQLGGFLGPELVAIVDVLRRDDETAIIEELAVHPRYQDQGYGGKLVRAPVASAQRAQLPILEVFALEREPKAVSFWRHLLGAPNIGGHLILLGTRRPAKGWRLPTAEISV
ncbi:MAG TPA: GNAT family N-acetyltransferase [Candidatus Dormibacteraeota bacterium]|nr:GNAT family N-acetyltransferase [Candidatus Dormibacteraeota bacterium]